jgi:hypothetical protein
MSWKKTEFLCVNQVPFLFDNETWFKSRAGLGLNNAGSGLNNAGSGWGRDLHFGLWLFARLGSLLVKSGLGF